MTSTFSIHIDGDILDNNLVSARTLGRVLTHSQNAFDRAFLDLKYGNLWKYARMKGGDYKEADFIALYPEAGSFIQTLLSKTGKEIVDRIQAAIAPAMERVLQEGEEVSDTLVQQVNNRKNQIARGLIEPTDYQDLIDRPKRKYVRKYADRAINRELDQILSIVRSQHSGESSLTLNLMGSSTESYQFNRYKSERFHKIVSRREIGEPVVYIVKVRQLDHHLLNGKVINSQNDRTLSIKFAHENDFMKVQPYLGKKEKMIFVGAPIIEYGAFEPYGGDVYFIELLE